MAKKVYKEITEKVKGISFYLDFDGGLDYVIETLQKYKVDAEELGYTKLQIEKCHWEDYLEYEIYGTRIETDTERDKRLAEERKIREERKAKKIEEEEQEREELARLKAKYEGES